MQKWRTKQHEKQLSSEGVLRQICTVESVFLLRTVFSLSTVSHSNTYKTCDDLQLAAFSLQPFAVMLHHTQACSYASHKTSLCEWICISLFKASYSFPGTHCVLYLWHGYVKIHEDKLMCTVTLPVCFQVLHEPLIDEDPVFITTCTERELRKRKKRKFSLWVRQCTSTGFICQVAANNTHIQCTQQSEIWIV